MKTFIAFAALMTVASANVLYSAGYAALPAAVPVSIMNHRFTRTDWSQPSVQYTIPAVAQYQSITPGFTSIHHAAAPIVAAPYIAHHGHHAPLVASHGHFAAPLVAGHYAAHNYHHRK